MKKYTVNRVWTTKAGLQACVIYKRHYCGYVAVPYDSNLYMMNYHRFLERAIKVHGGLTYSTSLPRCLSDYDTQTYPIESPEFTWWLGFDCGHYRSIGSAPHLRFDERNAHGQRKKCNRWGAGRAVDYRLGLIQRIGLEAVQSLESAQAHAKWTIDDLKAIKARYKAKLKELKACND